MNIIHKHVNSYHFQTYKSGIGVLLLNTHKRWCEYQMRNDAMCTFYDNDVSTGEDDFYIPATVFGDFDVADCVIATRQEKDQIIIYYLPVNMITKRL